MNTAQILRQALFDLDAVNADSTTDPFFTQTELLAWANNGKDELEKVLRVARQDYGLVVLQYNDVAFTWGNETYDPATLTVAAGTKYVTLPPDLLTLKRIRCLTSGYEHTRFVRADISTDDFKSLEGYTSGYPLGDCVYWSLVGERTLYLANTLSTTIDLEIAYITRSLPLQLYSTGTVSINNAAATVTGAGTAWVASRLYPNLDLIVSDDATAPKIVGSTAAGTWVTPGVSYYPIAAATGDGTTSLLANWPLASIAGRGYMLATIPPLPPEHHHLLVDYVAACGFGKQQNWASRDKKLSEFMTQIGVMQSDITRRQEHDIETVESWEPW